MLIGIWVRSHITTWTGVTKYTLDDGGSSKSKIETGRLVARLQSYGPLLGFVAGQWGEGSKDLHWFIQTCAEARAAHISRTSGQDVSEKKLGTIVSQYRRLVSTTACRAQALCLLERISLITPEAKAAADRRVLTMRRDEQLRQERRSQWMAQLS